MMRVLLDTHVFLWLTTHHPALSERQRAAYLDRETDLFLSVASYWEVCIKAALGKLELAPNWPEAFEREVLEGPVQWLPIQPAHCARLLELDHHHRDPFDRMLVAQALVEDLVIATSDRRIQRYPVQTL